jgi:hypothetical protein
MFIGVAMTKLRTAAVLTAFAAAAFAAPSFAQVSITDSVSCESEGGTMVNVKNSDYCLVPIRPAEYADPVYDGNQLGVVDCPGSKLNDGKYCMYPVTIRPAPATEASAAPAVDAMEAAPAPAAEMTRAEKRAAKKAAKKAAAEAAKLK